MYDLLKNKFSVTRIFKRPLSIFYKRYSIMTQRLILLNVTVKWVAIDGVDRLFYNLNNYLMFLIWDHDTSIDSKRLLKLSI